MLHPNALVRLAVLCGALVALPAHAGRPLVVDDADVAEAGTGHVEAWYGRLTGRTNTWNVAPVFVVVDGLELGAALVRDTTAPATGSALQAKWRITPVQEHGCNLGASVGASHVSRGGGNATFVNAIGTCNSDFGALHLNLGGNRASHGPTLGTWGVGPWNGPSTGSRPTWKPSASAAASLAFRPACGPTSRRGCRLTAAWAARNATRCSAWASRKSIEPTRPMGATDGRRRATGVLRPMGQVGPTPIGAGAFMRMRVNRRL